MKQTNIRKAIESQREKLDQMSVRAGNLTELLSEAKKMDRLVEIYEDRNMTA